MNELADLIFSLPHVIEWECLDVICKAALEALLSHIYTGWVRDYANYLMWIKIVTAILMCVQSCYLA